MSFCCPCRIARGRTEFWQMHPLVPRGAKRRSMGHPRKTQPFPFHIFAFCMINKLARCVDRRRSGVGGALVDLLRTVGSLCKFDPATKDWERPKTSYCADLAVGHPLDFSEEKLRGWKIRLAPVLQPLEAAVMYLHHQGRSQFVDPAQAKLARPD